MIIPSTTKAIIDIIKIEVIVDITTNNNNCLHH